MLSYSSPQRKQVIRIAIVLVAVAVGVFFWLSSGVEDSAPGPDDVSARQSGSRQANNETSKMVAEGTGSIRGRITFRGQKRDRPPDGRLLSDVVVYLKGAELTTRSTIEADDGQSRASKVDEERPAKALLDQVDMTFVPHVVLMQKGGTLELGNSDAALHNVNGLAVANKAFNVALSPGSTSEVVLDKPEFIRVVCNFHSRMNAWVAVLPNRYFTRVGDDGWFELTDVPAGTHVLAGWHEDVYPPYKSHRISVEVHVEPDQTAEVNLDFE